MAVVAAALALAAAIVLLPRDALDPGADTRHGDENPRG